MSTTIWQKVATALSGLGENVAAGTWVSASASDIPDRYLVYFLVSSPAQQHADDAETLRGYRVQVSVYDRAGLNGLPDVDGAMVAAGFARGPQRELPYNPDTRHFGLALEYIYME